MTCICGASEFARNEQVSKRIIRSKPQRFIIRSGLITLPMELENFTKLICLSNSEQWNFQSKFLDNPFALELN